MYVYFLSNITAESSLFSKILYLLGEGFFTLHFVTLIPNGNNLHLLKICLYSKSSKKGVCKAVIWVFWDLSILGLQVPLPLKLKSSRLVGTLVRPLRLFWCFYFLCFLTHISDWPVFLIQVHFGAHKYSTVLSFTTKNIIPLT